MRLSLEVPPLSARTLGFFRIALGLSLLAIVFFSGVQPVPVPLQRHYTALDFAFVHAIAASPDACRLLKLFLIGCAALFTVGLATRWVYGALVVGLLVAVLVILERSGAHDWGLPMVTLAGWLTVPWGDGLSLDQKLAPAARRVPAGARSRAYGFAIWFPGLTLGVGFLAAAYAKLSNTGGLTWITTGAVKYHFVTDAPSAAVDWGLWIASRPRVAVVASLLVILLEAGFILVLLARGPAARLVFGVLGAALFASFQLFHGVTWAPWRMLLLAFLPWEWLERERERFGAPAPLRLSQLAAAALVVIVQVFASATRTEIEPLVSNYPMYSTTYASTGQFDRGVAHRFTRIVEARADGVTIDGALKSLDDNDRVVLVNVAEDLAAGGVTPERSRFLPHVCSEYKRQQGSWPSEIVLRVERSGFDWDAGRFQPYAPVATAPVPLAALCAQLARATPGP